MNGLTGFKKSITEIFNILTENDRKARLQKKSHDLKNAPHFHDT